MKILMYAPKQSPCLHNVPAAYRRIYGKHEKENSASMLRGSNHLR